jgi:hypothetical protein
MMPVVVREMPLRELVELMLGIMGKDLGRMRETLIRGTFVSGASRFRWVGWEPDPAELEDLLRTFPDGEPDRPFEPARCTRAVFRAGGLRVEVGRDAAAKRRIFQRRSFWLILMDFAASATPQYVCYSYRERADRYRIPLSPSALARLLDSSRTLRYGDLAGQLRGLPAEVLELDVERG